GGEEGAMGAGRSPLTEQAIRLQKQAAIRATERPGDQGKIHCPGRVARGAGALADDPWLGGIAVIDRHVPVALGGTLIRPVPPKFRECGVWAAEAPTHHAAVDQAEEPVLHLARQWLHVAIPGPEGLQPRPCHEAAD